MSIAVTPRVGPHSRRDDDRLKAENDLLLEIAARSIHSSLSASKERGRLRAAGMIESYRHPILTKHKNSYWRLTDAGRARVAAIRAREGKS